MTNSDFETDLFHIHGITMESIVSENEHIERKLGRYEYDVLRWMQDVKPSFYIDVGSFCGYFALHMRKQLASVICFEPGEAYPVLEKNFGENFDGGYNLYQYALSNEYDSVEAGIGGCGFVEMESGIDVEGSKRVETARLDDFLSDEGYDLSNQKSLLKIDTEGLERQVLEGAEDVLDDIDYLVVEYHPSYVNTGEISRTRGLIERSGFERDAKFNGEDPHEDNMNICYKKT